MQTLVIGDIHGCYAELRALLDKAGLTEADHIISIGDCVDRGPETPDAGYTTVLGAKVSIATGGGAYFDTVHVDHSSTFAGGDLIGYTAEQVSALLAQVAAQFKVKPLTAVVPIWDWRPSPKIRPNCSLAAWLKDLRPTAYLWPVSFAVT